MQGKLVWALAFVGFLVIIGPASGCRLCGRHSCGSCGGQSGFERSGVSLTMPILQPAPMGMGVGGLGMGLGGYGGLGPLGLGGLGPLGMGGHGVPLGLGGVSPMGLGFGASMAGGNMCANCGGYNNGHYPRGDGGHGHGYCCRCSPRRRYNDY